MAEKAKAKKSKALAKKTASIRPKKKEISVKDAYHETDVEDLQLAQEELPKRGVKSSKVVAEKKSTSVPEKKIDTKSIQSEEASSKISQSAPEIIVPIQPRVVVNKPVASPSEIKVEKPRQEMPRQETKANAPTAGANDGLRVRLSESLVKKLKEQAADEGISLEEFISELLAESVVLRAWEIVERKNAMKGPSGQGPTGGGRNNYNNQNQGNKGNNQRGGGGGGSSSGSGAGNQGNKGHRGMSQVRYQSIMDDKATFLEYVRSQEKPRR